MSYTFFRYVFLHLVKAFNLHADIKKKKKAISLLRYTMPFSSSGECRSSILDPRMLYIAADVWFKDIGHTNALSVHIAYIQRKQRWVPHWLDRHPTLPPSTLMRSVFHSALFACLCDIPYMLYFICTGFSKLLINKTSILASVRRCCQSQTDLVSCEAAAEPSRRSHEHRVTQAAHHSRLSRVAMPLRCLWSRKEKHIWRHK